MKTSSPDEIPGYTWIFVKWITRKGKRYYPPKGQKAWRIRVKNRP